MKRFGLLILAAAVALTTVSYALADVPRLVSFQGNISETGGPLHGTYDLAFSVYADSVGGAALWTEPHAGVAIDHGVLNVILGRSAPITDALLAHGELWMGIAVGSDPEMAPRLRMTSVHWAMRAAVAESCLVSAPDGDWTIAGANVYRTTGNVGIGTAAPAYRLDARDATADAYLHVSGQDDGKSGLMLNEGSAYLCYDGAAPEIRLWNAVTGGNAGDIAFGTNNLERMRIKRDGQVGIGVMAPADMLEVAGTARMNGFRMPTGAASGYVLTSNASGVGTWQAPAGGASDGDWTILGSNQYSAVSGNVGIGTMSPTTKLMVVSSATDVAVQGSNSPSGNFGYLGGGSLGAYGRNGTSQNAGQLGATLYGAYGSHNATGSTGALGSDSAGVYGIMPLASRPGVYGRGTGAASIGVQGVHTATQNLGQLGTSLYGAIGQNASGSYGYLGADTVGVYGYTTSLNHAAVFGLGGGLNADGVKGVHGATENYGILGFETAGVVGRAFEAAHSGVIGYNGSDIGSLGISGRGVSGWSPAGYGVHGGTSTGFAGYFSGDVTVIGTLSKTHGSFVIDHPLDPMNKILRHMFVESPENLCVYRGKIALDASGEGVVTLPSYFVALTKEDGATVSLTSIGRPFLTGYEWLPDFSAFRVYGEAGREISWVAYADRDDPAARKLTRPVEEDKGPNNKLCDRGKLLNP